MVWKRLILFVLMLAVLSALPISASAYSVYQEGNISTTYLTYFKDMSTVIGINDDYVFFRSGQNEYTLAVGELELASGYIRGSNIDIYQIYSVTASGYNTVYAYGSTTQSSFVLQVASSLIYSNLGNYPQLIERSVYNETAILLVMCISFFGSIASAIFSYGKRRYS